MKASNRTFRVLLSHLCAVAIGALLVLQWEALVLTKSSDSSSGGVTSVSSWPNLLNPVSCQLSETSSAASPEVGDKIPQRLYDLLPVVIHDHVKVPRLVDMHKNLLNAQLRIHLPRNNNNNTTNKNLVVGPFHVFYPSVRHEEMKDWL